MDKLPSLSLRQRLMIGGAGVIIVIGLIVLIALLARSQSDAASEQPIAFNHQIHAQNDIQCQFCHYGVNQGPSAVIPSVEKCMGCHQFVATDNPEVRKIAEYWADEEPIPWVRVNEQPDFVYFNHHSHVAAGVSCGSCHGDVANMSVAEPVAKMNMGFCLDCHAEQDNKDALYDCAVCHR